VLTAAIAIGATGTRDRVTGHIQEQADTVIVLEMSALRVSGNGACDDPGFGDLAADCVARLRARLARPRRAPDDWSIELPAGGRPFTLVLDKTSALFTRERDVRTRDETDLKWLAEWRD
jgi:hypothetical protein